ncbi:MAG: uroporphyrinogen decarboxylase [Ectothiorhodospiraceae bacterium]
MTAHPPLQNDLLLRALMRQPTERTPVWLMRQAGRYLPEYRATRERAGSFMDLCQNPELACEVTLQPVQRYPVDGAILFSDILTVPHAMGLGLYFVPGEGPHFQHTVRDEAAVDALPLPDPEQELRYVPDALRLVRRELGGRLPVIGFTGSPWTLATYMIEGGPSKNYAWSKAMLYDRPELMHRLLDKLARAVTDYLNAQIAAGAQALMIFDTWGGILTPDAYQAFSLHYAKRIISGLSQGTEGQHVPVVLFTKNGGPWLEAQAASGADGLGLDWTQDIGEARRRVGDQVALQGNLDPSALYASPATIRELVHGILDAYGPGSGHVFNLGHGVHPEIDPEHVAAMIDAVHTFSPGYHSAMGS